MKTIYLTQTEISKAVLCYLISNGELKDNERVTMSMPDTFAVKAEIHEAKTILLPNIITAD